MQSASNTIEKGRQAGESFPSRGAEARAAIRGVDFHPEPDFFSSLPKGFGQHALSLSVAGMRVSLSGLDARQASELAARYGIFARRPAVEDAPCLEVEIRRSPRDSFLVVNDRGKPEMYRLLSRWVPGGADGDGAALMAWSYEWAAIYRFGAGRATLVAASGERVVFDRIVENFLRVAYAHLVLQRGGILLHAAGVVRDGVAYAFFGPSGSGKTTATALSAGALVLSDDLLMIVPCADGPGAGGYVATSVPFRGVMTPPASSDAVYPLGGLYRLVQAPEHRLEPLSGARAAGEIVQSLPFVTDRPEAASAVLEVVSAISAQVGVGRLHFRKDPGFWDALGGS